MRDDDIFLLIVIFFVVIGIAVGITIQVFFLLTLQKCLQRIDARNRTMEPGLVWLNLIPCVGNIWIFFTVFQIAASLRNEWRSRRWDAVGENFAQNIGLAWAILSIIAAIPYVGVLFAIGAFICWIIYWVQIANYSQQMAQPFERRRDYEPDDDYDRRYHDRLDEPRPRSYTDRTSSDPYDDRFREER